MASKSLKGLTVEIGGETSGLLDALAGVEKKSRSLSTELGQINRLLKLDPSNVELLAQKQRVLTEAISSTEEKLGTLREAEKQVQAQFERGEVTEAQYRALQREIVATENKLNGYKKAAQDTADAVEELGDDSKAAANGIKLTEQQAKDADDALSDMGDTVAGAAKAGIGALVAAATAAVTGLFALVEATREYRTEMGKLDTAFSASGHASATAQAAYKELYGVIGETDQAVEAAQQIALLADSAEEVSEWADLAAGVVGRFGDALQPETFYEAANETLKLGEATGAYVQLLEGTGEDVEAFNEGLAACNTEAEKQEYLLETTNRLLGDAAAEYKETNAEVIRANTAADEWNSTLATIGGYMEPVVTDIKEMGVALLEDAEEPLKNVANYIRSTFLPALTEAGSWVKNNLPQITNVVAGLTATVVLYKAAVLSSELATKGLTVATLAQQAAQKALNLVMNANPWVLAATAIAAVTTAILAFDLATEETVEAVDVLTEEERELCEAANEAAEAFRDQQDATKEAMGEISANMGHVQSLATELQGLADASGQVQEKDQARADFILNELNAALGTEYEMVGGVIQQYDELKTSIDQVIQSKLANSLIEAANADYVTAIQNEKDALQNLVNAEKDYQAQVVITQQKEAEYATEKERLQGLYQQALENMDTYGLNYYTGELGRLDADLQAHRDNLAGKEEAYNQAAANYGNYYSTIANYEEAQAAVLNGNYDRAVEILTEKGQVYGTYSDKVDSETAAVIDSLFEEAVKAGLEAERMKTNFENGVEGYTEEMVKEAEQGYEEALNAYADAYADAEGVGSDLSDGLEDGMESGRLGLLDKAKSLVSGIISAMREEADSHSPARKLIAFGEDIGAGAEIGIDNSTDDVSRAARSQASAILDAYNSQELDGQNALRKVADRGAAQQATSQLMAASSNAPLLEKILTAIEKGQVLCLDGDAIVGGTVGRMDTLLGRRRILVERGAL